jgi:FkbM family methyltransferase
MIATPDLSDEEFNQLFKLAKRVLWSNHETRRKLQGLGINIVPANFYSEIPTHAELDASFEYAEDAPFDGPMFDPAPMTAFATEHLLPYCDEFSPPADNPHTPDTREYFWNCPEFRSTDALAYYAMIRNRKPRRIIEIGSGYSTLVAMKAVAANGFGEIVCIEPFPKDWLRKLPIRLLDQKVQTLPAEFFERDLADGDILFIDSTHTVKNGSDVLHLYLRVLPRLTRDLMVHVHDIYLPYPLPLRSATETQIYWTEQYLLHAYLLDNPKIRFLWSSVIGANRFRDLMIRMLDGKNPVGGSSVWFALNGQLASADRAPARAAAPASAATTKPDDGPATVALQSLRLFADAALIPEKTLEALRRGRYEFKEREIARRLLRSGDRVIELGAGMGVVSLTMANLIGAEAVRSFEANPRIVELARRNAAINGLPVTFCNQIAAPRAQAIETPSIDFYVLNSFEASSTRQGNPSQKAVSIPATPLEDEIAAHCANVLVFDIEGFETEIVGKADLSGIERLMFEIHPKILGMDTCLGLIAALEAQGLTLRRDLAFGDVLAFDRSALRGAVSGEALFNTLHDMEAAELTQDWEAAYDIGLSVEEEIAQNPYVQFRMAMFERALGKPSVARAERAVGLDSQDFLLFTFLAGEYLKAGDRAKARQAVDRLGVCFPQSADLDALRARVS